MVKVARRRELFTSTPSAPTPGLCLASSHSSPASLPQQDSRAPEVEALSCLTQAQQLLSDMQALRQVLLWEDEQVFIPSTLGQSLNLCLLWEAPS